MNVTVRGPRAIRRSPTRAVVTVGMFDGVHLAHQRLIASTVSLARRLRGTSVVITFDPDPQCVLDPAHAQPALMPLDARVQMLHALGIDLVWVIPFTTSFSRLRAEQFIRKVLIDRLHPLALIIGENFMFGRRRHGDEALLRSVGPRYGMRIVAIPRVRHGGVPISSSRVRQLMAAGRLADARRLLGRPPELYGQVVRGAGRGRRLGIPTINLRVVSHVLPPRGVYAVQVHDVGTLRRRRLWPGVMNLGVRPTFGPGPLVCEIHLLGFSGTFHGRFLQVSLLARLRDERCFPSPQALVQHVRRDLARARRLFARLV